jgi:hypothetical protein
MRVPGLLLVGLTSALLCGCATVSTQGAKSVQSTLDGDGETSSYGQYLAGQAAVNHADSASAEAYFAKAAGIDPQDRSLLTTRAFTSALLAGDITTAAALAPTDPEADSGLRHLGALVRAVEYLSTGKPKLAHAILLGPDASAGNEPAAALLTPFAAAASGNAEASIGHPVINGEPVAQFFANLDQGKLFERAHRFDEAETAFRALIAKGDPGGIASLSLG